MPLNRMLPALVFGALVLSGCSSSEKAAEPSTPAASADGRCDASKVQGLIGKPLSAALVEQAPARCRCADCAGTAPARCGDARIQLDAAEHQRR